MEGRKENFLNFQNKDYKRKKMKKTRKSYRVIDFLGATFKGPPSFPRL